MKLAFSEQNLRNILKYKVLW